MSRLPISQALSRALVLLGLLGLVAPIALAQEDPHRLGDQVVPSFQAIELKVDGEQMNYKGSVRIELEVQEATSSFRLHSQEHEFKSVGLSDGGSSIEVQYEVGEADLVTFTAEKELSPGEYTLIIDFTNDFDTQARGLYRLVSEGDAYLFTQFEATDARQAFPCFDEPRFKIPFQMTLIVPEAHAAVSNTPIAKETTEAGWRRVEFAQTKPMPSYLLALSTGPLEFVPVEGMDIPVNVITPKGKSHLAAEAAKCTPPLLAALEEYFGRPYPYAKLDLIAVPEFWPGAMENIGLITFRDNLLLLDSETVTVSQLRSLARVNAHEIAHQWFGNLVTMEWWDDLWLNEAFATWIGTKITDQVYPEYGIAVTSVRGTLGAMGTDALVNTRAIRQPVKATDNMLQSADGLTYQKGAAVLGMFEEWMGADLFREGVVNYINANEWGNAEAGHLWSSLSETSGVDMGAAMSTFLDQPGVPLVSATPLGDGKVELRQERFFHHGVDPTGVAGGDAKWTIPVVFRYADGKTTRTERVLLTESTQMVELPTSASLEWIHPNAGEKGYYHWDIDPDKLMALADKAVDLLDVRERTAMVGQLSALLDAGRIDGGQYLRATANFADDPRPEVVSAMLGALGLVRQAFVTDEVEPAFAQYVRTMLEPAAERFGLEMRAGEEEAVTMFRPNMISWLGKYGHSEQIVDFAKTMTMAYLEDPSSVDTGIINPCLQIAALDGDWKLYNQFKKKFETASTPRDRQRFLGALGWFRDPQIIKAGLYYTLNGELRPQEIFSIPMGVGQANPNASFLWTWMTENYDALMEKMPPMFAIYMPYFAGGCTTDRIEAARIFFAEDGEHYVTGQEKELAKVTEAVGNCAGLREREGQAVARYLSKIGEM